MCNCANLKIKWTFWILNFKQRAFSQKQNQMCDFNKLLSLLEYNPRQVTCQLSGKLQKNSLIWLVVGVNLSPCKPLIMFATVLWIFLCYDNFYATFMISSRPPRTSPSQPDYINMVAELQQSSCLSLYLSLFLGVFRGERPGEWGTVGSLYPVSGALQELLCPWRMRVS